MAGRVILCLLLGTLSGAAWGLHETIMHHYPLFQAAYPTADPQWWNPALSWLNKYNGHNVSGGRNHIPIWFTDGMHLTASVTQVTLLTGGGVVGFGRKKRYEYLIDLAAFAAGYIISNAITYQ